MTADVDAVIAALRVVLDEAQKSGEAHWKVETANRWVNHLPGSWSGRWRKLQLKGDATGDARREEFVAHVRAVLAFLDANRLQIPKPRRWWSLRRRNAPIQPVPVAPAPAAKAAPKRPVNLLRVRKPMPGIH